MKYMITDAVKEQIDAYITHLIDGSSAESPLWNIEKIRSGKPNKWNYIDGCMMTAELALYDITGDRKYLDAADSFLGWFVEEDGTIRTYDLETFNLDNIKPGTSLLRLYTLTGKKKYRKAADILRRQLDAQPRTEAGNFWHKKIYPYQVWLDSLYMAQPFYMEYETRFNKMYCCEDSIRQFRTVEDVMKDPETGLYFHGYDESRQMYWADPKTGCSPSFWLRSLGWFLAALTDTAEATDESLYYEFRSLTKMLKDVVEAMLRWQGEDGMFCQVVTRPGDEGNYPETSGTALFAYAVLKAVRLGYLPERFREPAMRAFDGIVRRYLTTDENGTLQLGGICLVAGLGGADRRDGTPAYYYSEPVVVNEAKGTAPFILAYTEILRLQD